MIQESIQAVILAAGKATRFHTGRTKLIEPLCGQEMILYSTQLFKALQIPITVVVGYQKELVQQVLTTTYPNDSLSFVVQEEQKGTGHALLCTSHTWHADHIIVINGDMPLIHADIMQQLLATHHARNAAISFVVAHNTQPNTGYGRIVREGTTVQIIEAKEFSGDVAQHSLINAGIYVIKREFLEQHSAHIRTLPHGNEFYITDLVKIASDNHFVIEMLEVPFDRVRGINTLHELHDAELVQRAEIIRYWMARGVRFASPEYTYVDLQVTIGAGTIIGAGVHLLKHTTIGKNCTIKAFSVIENSTLADGVIVHPHSVINNAHIKECVQIGPFAHIKEQVTIEDHAVVGNFVEMKETQFGARSKAKHLSYLGNATIGSDVNIGAGTIVCNHDGTGKQETNIKEGAYIGSNATLIAPLTIEEHAFIAAGSTITNPVPAHALAIGRARQLNKHGYAITLKNKRAYKSLTFNAAQQTTNDTNTPDHS
jgi:bifunctional UDP-N-acetylglucosamine pyrophosphorylase / glucosamine-1-phosphate N-acetyltransferase